MVESVETIFAIFKQYFESKHPNYKDKLKLASGCPSDAKLDILSDVDISLLDENYANLDNLFPSPKFTKKIHDTKPSCIYSINYHGREVNIYATSDPNIANRSVTHRNNELELCKHCPILAGIVVQLKRSGLGTEKAWAKVLKLEGDPYEAMLCNNLDKGIELEKKLVKIYI